MPFNFISIKFTSKPDSLVLIELTLLVSVRAKAGSERKCQEGSQGQKIYPASCARLLVHRCVHFAKIQSEA